MTPTRQAEHSSHFPDWSAWPIRKSQLGRFLIAYLVLVGSGLAIGALLIHSPVGDPIEEADVDVSQWFEAERTADLTEASGIASQLGGTIWVIVSVVVLAVVFAFTFRRWRESASLVSALGLEATVFLTVSTVIGRSRPPVEMLDVSPPTGSFPSGHTGAATALYLTLAAVVWWHTKNAFARFAAGALAVILPTGVAIARQYRGMHFVSDVVVGILLGGSAALVAMKIVQLATNEEQS